VLGSGGAALAGGINMMLMASTTFMFRKAGMLSADGRCKALDQAADGYVRSEVRNLGKALAHNAILVGWVLC
jgi:acyl transferase domain-containing protein